MGRKGIMLKIKADLDRLAKELIGFIARIDKQKRELHSKAGEAVKSDVFEHYNEEFEKSVNPNSSWQRLKEALGLPPVPGYFTGSTVESLMVEATAEAAKVRLEGKWPRKSKFLRKLEDSVYIDSRGVTIKIPDSFEFKGKKIFIPAERFERKTYGEWTGKDVVFLKIRPSTKEEAIKAMKIELEALIKDYFKIKK
jgi:hypothetical protein